jgi:hypothetical protein
VSSDLRVVLPNRPGTLVGALEALHAAGIDIEGFCGDLRPGEVWGFLHVLVADPKRAGEVLEAAGYQITSQHNVDVLEIVDEPGALAAAARQFSDDGRNIEVLYLGRGGRLVIGTEDMQEPRLGIRLGDPRH